MLGHMWELYAMWAWIPLFLAAAYRDSGLDPRAAHLAGFTVIAAGAAGCLAVGAWADRQGRTRTTITCLVVSGGCALVVGFLRGHPLPLTLVCLSGESS